MSEFVSAYDQDITFITGFAGSGKSTRLAAECKEDNTLVLTPTHMAASVLQSKGIKNVFTIHSVLKLVPTINENFKRGQKMERLQKIGDVKLDSIKKIAIDEFSMINVAILDMLLAVLPTNCKVLVFGDPYQLPPVDGEPIDPEAYTDNIEELTTQHRADAPEVVETFMRFMNYIKYGTGRNLKFNPKIKKGNLNDFNPDTDRALAYTNNKVISLNSEIAAILGKDDVLAEDDEILLNGIDCLYYNRNNEHTPLFPTCISKGKFKEGDELEVAIQSTVNDIEKYATDLSPFDTCTVVVNSNEYSIWYDDNHYFNSKQYKKDVEIWQNQVYQHNKIPEGDNLAQWCRANPNAKYVKERAKAWSKYLTHKNLVFDLRRPYATTVHKSQGKEFSTVYIAQDDIKRAIRNNYYEQYARLMYVALSRAINRVVII